MAETDVKIKDAPLSSAISGSVKIPVSDGTNLPKTATLSQVYSFIKNGLRDTDGFATTSDIPSKVSQLDNDSGFITSAALAPYAKTADLPTKLSQFTNDSKFVSSDVTNAMAKEIAENTGNIERLIESHDTLGNATALNLDLMNLPKVVGVPWFVIQDGVPTKAPVFIGQIYLDKTNKKVYFAFGVSSSSDWIVLN